MNRFVSSLFGPDFHFNPSLAAGLTCRGLRPLSSSVPGTPLFLSIQLWPGRDGITWARAGWHRADPSAGSWNFISSSNTSCAQMWYHFEAPGVLLAPQIPAFMECFSFEIAFTLKTPFFTLQLNFSNQFLMVGPNSESTNHVVNSEVVRNTSDHYYLI